MVGVAPVRIGLAKYIGKLDMPMRRTLSAVALPAQEAAITNGNIFRTSRDNFFAKTRSLHLLILMLFRQSIVADEPMHVVVPCNLFS